MPNSNLKNFQAYDLSLQLYRKCEAVPAKRYLKDQVRFYAIAFGSIREVQACFDLMDLKDETILQIADRIAGCCYRLVYGPGVRN